jgi:alkylation response protein AidB-like acyl-CoA dehydrogenase
LCAGVAFEQLGEKLVEEQEIVMKLSDIAIGLFAAESALYRALKAVSKNGIEKEALKVNLATTFVQDTVLEVETNARRIVAGLTSGEKQNSILALIQKVYSQFQPEGFIERNRKIAEDIYDENGYSC